MFEIYNPTPMSIQVDHDNHRITFPPGETKGKWDTGGYIGPEDAEYITSDKKWGRVGLVLRAEGERQTAARQRGLGKFVNHVNNTVRDWLAMNSELTARRRPPKPLFMQRGLEPLVDMAESVSNSPGYAGLKLTKNDVLMRYNQLVGGVITVQGGNGNGGNDEVKRMIAAMEAKLTDMSERQQLLEEENDALRAKLDKAATPVTSLEEVPEIIGANAGE